MSVTINSEEVKAKEFAYDDCHKIYLIETVKDKKKLIEYGYDLYPIDALEDVWSETCPLRFIESADLKRTWVAQCAKEPVIEVAA